MRSEREVLEKLREIEDRLLVESSSYERSCLRAVKMTLEWVLGRIEDL